GELRGLKGALFFSDGRGIFPSVPPEYETTFVFLKDRYDAIDVPGWVRRLVVDAPPPTGREYFEY
ncbi:MAG: metallopeptidase, partial [Dysosmobacter sp.]|nr:metallopeptidase [Dysosmobacter sp.]